MSCHIYCWWLMELTNRGIHSHIFFKEKMNSLVEIWSSHPLFFAFIVYFTFGTLQHLAWPPKVHLMLIPRGSKSENPMDLHESPDKIHKCPLPGKRWTFFFGWTVEEKNPFISKFDAHRKRFCEMTRHPGVGTKILTALADTQSLTRSCKLSTVQPCWSRPTSV